MNYNSRIDFLGLHAFVAVAERGSFRDAAAHLNLSNTAISHRIRKLEEEVGQKLFLRTNRDVTLTKAGVELLPKVQQTLYNLAGALDELKQASKNRQERLSVGCLPTIATGRLPNIVMRLRKLHPDLLVEIYDKSAAEISELVANGTVEVGVTLISSHRWDFQTEVLVEDPFILVCPEHHLFGDKKAINWSELANHPLIRVSQQSGNRMIIDDALAGQENSLNWAYEAQHLQTAVAMARAGAALAIVPRMTFAAADESGLRLLPLEKPSIKRQLGIVSKSGAALSSAAQAFISIVKEVFAETSSRADTV